MNQKFTIFAINPGSTSTKAALFENERLVAQTTLRHRPEELAACGEIPSQKELRMRYLLDFMKEQNADPASLDAFVGRGGLLRPIPSGTYTVNEAMIADLTTSAAARHASTLGGLIAGELGKTFGKPAYIVDPVVVDELEPVARFSGVRRIERRSVFHALNQKAIARRYAAETGKKYEELRLIVAHLGGGISVGAHLYGRVVDVNNALDGEGPFSPERCGGLPVSAVVEACFSGDYTKEQMMALTNRTGGVMSYLGTNDMFAAERAALADPDSETGRVFFAMGYQIAKEIAAMAAVLACGIDAILLTGGLARAKPLVTDIERRIGKLAPLRVYPGEDEMAALVCGALRVLAGEEEAKVY